MTLPTAGQATAAAIGKGTTLGYLAGAGSGAFVIVAELLDLKAPEQTASPIAIQRYDSPTFFEELIAGWAKGGKVSFTVVYNAAQAAALYAMFNVPGQIQITKPASVGSGTITVAGICTKFGDEIPLKDKMMNQMEFEVSGAPIFSSTSA